MWGAWHEAAYQDRCCFCQRRTQDRVKPCLFECQLQPQHLAWYLAKVLVNQWVSIREHKLQLAGAGVQDAHFSDSPETLNSSSSPQFSSCPYYPCPALKFLTQRRRDLCYSVTRRPSQLFQSSLPTTSNFLGHPAGCLGALGWSCEASKMLSFQERLLECHL